VLLKSSVRLASERARKEGGRGVSLAATPLDSPQTFPAPKKEAKRRHSMSSSQCSDQAPDPVAVCIFRDLVAAYQRGDFRSAAALAKRLRGVGFVVRPLPSALGPSAPTPPPHKPDGPPLARANQRRLGV